MGKTAKAKDWRNIAVDVVRFIGCIASARREYFLAAVCDYKACPVSFLCVVRDRPAKKSPIRALPYMICRQSCPAKQ
ncbi:hypothetical protein NL54_01800 [Pantoea stewartii]|nr:hypothetical protein NL54_01800 [Pantoea stewartii]KHN61966.1 hypothetical protein OI73_14020 [Pantoea stewartii]NRH22272.1 hypothetical protein [Pantoea stewartii]